MQPGFPHEEAQMSDGPHKSLPMRRAWKRVCEVADNAAHALEEVIEGIAPALAADARGEISDGFLRRLRRALGLDAEQLPLFDDAGQAVVSARTRAESTMEADLADAIGDALRDGLSGIDALRGGIRTALEDRGLAAVRAVEEHYLLKSPKSRAQHVRDRLHAGLAGAAAAVASLTEGLVNGTISLPVAPATSRSGLDEGPRL
jgi:hypothetical protein